MQEPFKSTDEYTKGEANRCPNKKCDSTDIEGGPIDIEGQTAIQEVSCNECEGVWNDVYTLSSYEVTALPTFFCHNFMEKNMNKELTEISVRLNSETAQTIYDLVATGFYVDESEVCNEILRKAFREEINQRVREIREKRKKEVPEQ